MSERKPLSKEQRRIRAMEFDDRLAALMEEYKDVAGPLECLLHGRDQDACECPAEDAAVPSEGYMVREYILGVSWTNMETGTSLFTYATGESMLLSHTLGLLALVQMRVEEDV